MIESPTLADLIAQAPGNQRAVILPEDGASITYRDLADQVERLALALRASGLEPGQSVAIVLPNGLENLALFLAVTRARLIAAPLNPAYKLEEFRFFLEDSGSRALIVSPGEHPARDAARERGLPVWTALLKSPAGQARQVVLEGASAPAQDGPSKHRDLTISPCSCTPAAPRAGPRACRSATAT